MRTSLLALLAFGSAELFGCSRLNEPGTSADSDLDAIAPVPELPAPGGTGERLPWGGADASKWRPEATIANAASLATNAAWSRADVEDVVVAIPLKLWSSDFFEFGDGQANARPSLESWSETSRPPVVATLTKFRDGSTKLALRFDRSLPYAGNAFELRYDATTVPLTTTRDAANDAVVEVALPSDLPFGNLLSEQSALVHPVGWSDWFPLQFRMPVKKIAELDVARLTFSDGKSIIDRERISSVGASDGRTPLERLLQHSFTGAYNGTVGPSQPFTPSSIHATYPFFRTPITTGVGRGWTWVADERPQDFKVMYTCFEGRRPDLEASAPNGGVASGGGWHQINDAAETILNDLEAGPLMVASGKNNPWLESHLPTGGFAYGLSDVATFRWLRPGEAFITVKGSPVSDANGHSFQAANYHWYFFHGANAVCTEELVNPPGRIPEGYRL